MSGIVELIEVLSKLAWPIIIVWVIFLFKESIKDLIGEAKKRKFTIKVGGNELTVEEASEQQRRLITDLQQQISSFQYNDEENTINLNGVREQWALFEEPQRQLSKPISNILWVDDKPKNNSFLIAALEDMDIKVTIAKSTSEAMDNFSPGKFDRIISDMGRPEGGKAGIELVKIIREHDKNTPFYIFCGGWAADNLKEEALGAGANGITSSGTRLLAMIKTPPKA